MYVWRSVLGIGSRRLRRLPALSPCLAWCPLRRSSLRRSDLDCVATSLYDVSEELRPLRMTFGNQLESSSDEDSVCVPISLVCLRGSFPTSFLPASAYAARVSAVLAVGETMRSVSRVPRESDQSPRYAPTLRYTPPRTRSYSRLENERRSLRVTWIGAASALTVELPTPAPQRAPSAPHVTFPSANTARIASFRALECETSRRWRYVARHPHADEKGTASTSRRADAALSAHRQKSLAVRLSKAQAISVALLSPSASDPATSRTRALWRLGPRWPYSHEPS